MTVGISVTIRPSMEFFNQLPECKRCRTFTRGYQYTLKFTSQNTTYLYLNCNLLNSVSSKHIKTVHLNVTLWAQVDDGICKKNTLVLADSREGPQKGAALALP